MLMCIRFVTTLSYLMLQPSVPVVVLYTTTYSPSYPQWPDTHTY